MDNTPNHLSINKALFLLSTLSPLVSTHLDTEGYRLTAEQDEVTDLYILNTSVTALTKDLEEIGIQLLFDPSDLSDDLSSLFDFLHLMSYLLPNTLYQKIKHNSSLKESVNHILSGSLGDNQTTLQIYLSDLGGLDDQPPLVPSLTHVTDHYYTLLSQNETFTDYLQNIQSLLDEERLTPESDPQTHLAYQEKIKTWIGKLTDATTLFDHDSNYPDLLRLQKAVIQDWTSHQNFHHYHYLFTTDIHTLPDDLQPIFTKRWYEFDVSHPWRLDYYLARQLKPSPPQIIMLYCMSYALCPAKDNWGQCVSRLRQHYPSPKIEFTLTPLFGDTQ